MTEKGRMKDACGRREVGVKKTAEDEEEEKWSVETKETNEMKSNQKSCGGN